MWFQNERWLFFFFCALFLILDTLFQVRHGQTIRNSEMKWDFSEIASIFRFK